jgi:hypothetical protein
MSILRLAGLAFLLAALLVVPAGLLSQELGPNEREVKTAPPKAGKSDVWALDFRFKDPRLIKVHIPGRGTRICWYLWYQVINRNDKAVRFQPIFELVSHDYPATFQDEILPSVEDAIKKIEDPSDYQKIKSTYAIGLNLIPVSKPPEEAFPTTVTGVAIWDASPEDLKKREAGKRDLSDVRQFSIFVRGLSNGQVVVDPPGPGLPPQTREKTLQLKFRRKGDRYSTDSRDMIFVGPAEWTYRPSSRNLIPQNREKGTDAKSDAKAPDAPAPKSPESKDKETP